MQHHTTISIDLAKTIFQIAIFSRHGKPLLNQAVKAHKMCQLVSQHPNAVILMEACGTSHYWGRYFSQRGHTVKLIPAQLAAKYRSGNKNDRNDAIAIFEASKHSKLHPVSVRTLEQQDVAVLHKFREGIKKERLQVSNRIRGLALEYGVTIPQGIKALMRALPEALEDADNELTPAARQVLQALGEQLSCILERYEQADQLLQSHVKMLVPCEMLTELPGFGWIVASCVYAKFGDAKQFKRGRDGSASLGIVPAHAGSGGRVIIGHITRRGDSYTRSMVINGARSVVATARKKSDPLSLWIQQLLATKSFNVVVVAVANKLIRMAVAMLKTGQPYQPPVAQIKA